MTGVRHAKIVIFQVCHTSKKIDETGPWMYLFVPRIFDLRSRCSAESNSLLRKIELSSLTEEDEMRSQFAGATPHSLKAQQGDMRGDGRIFALDSQSSSLDRRYTMIPWLRPREWSERTLIECLPQKWHLDLVDLEGNIFPAQKSQ